MTRINSYKDLRVYQLAFELSMQIFEISKSFPIEERYSLTDQIRRSSRSVCANTAEAYRRRRYPKAFVAKLSDSETEACETQVWLDFALACKYISEEQHAELYKKYDSVIGMLVKMITNPNDWKF